MKRKCMYVDDAASDSGSPGESGIDEQDEGSGTDLSGFIVDEEEMEEDTEEMVPENGSEGGGLESDGEGFADVTEGFELVVDAPAPVPRPSKRRKRRVFDSSDDSSGERGRSEVVRHEIAEDDSSLFQSAPHSAPLTGAESRGLSRGVEFSDVEEIEEDTGTLDLRSWGSRLAEPSGATEPLDPEEERDDPGYGEPDSEVPESRTERSLPVNISFGIPSTSSGQVPGARRGKQDKGRSGAKRKAKGVDEGRKSGSKRRKKKALSTVATDRRESSGGRSRLSQDPSQHLKRFAKRQGRPVSGGKRALDRYETASATSASASTSVLSAANQFSSSSDAPHSFRSDFFRSGSAPQIGWTTPDLGPESTNAEMDDDFVLSGSHPGPAGYAAEAPLENADDSRVAVRAQEAMTGHMMRSQNLRPCTRTADQAEQDFRRDVCSSFNVPEDGSFGSLFPSFAPFPPPASWYDVMATFELSSVHVSAGRVGAVQAGEDPCPEERTVCVAAVKYVLSLSLVLSHSALWYETAMALFVANPDFHMLIRTNLEFATTGVPYTRPGVFDGTPFARFSGPDYEVKVVELVDMVRAYRTMTMRMSRFNLAIQTGNFSDAIAKDLQEGGIEDPVSGEEVLAPPSKDSQQLLSWLSNRAAQDGLKRKEDGFYRPKILQDGTFCHYYEFFQNFEDFTWQAINARVLNPEMFDVATSSPKVTSDMVFYMQRMVDKRIDKFVPDRTLFATRNGLIDGRKGVVYVYSNNVSSGLNREKIRPVSDLDKTRFACNFLDQEIDLQGFSDAMDANDPLLIRTPLNDSILKHQGFTKEDMLWQYGMMGRNVFPLDDSLDKWQMMTYIYGLAGTGKSTFIEIHTAMYPCTAVQRMMAESTSDFKEQNIIKDDVYIVYHPDMDKNCKYPSSLLRAIIDGDWIQVNRKGQPSIAVKANSHVVVGSNIPPVMFKDNAGAMVRRCFITKFPKPVSSGDGQLKQKCLDNLANIVLKDVMCYHLLASKYGKCSNLHGMDILPPMVKQTRKEHLQSVSKISRSFRLLSLFQIHLVLICGSGVLCSNNIVDNIIIAASIIFIGSFICSSIYFFFFFFFQFDICFFFGIRSGFWTRRITWSSGLDIQWTSKISWIR
mmetsp:Transcript_4615/g.7302  ORF Transcript_4615/g.7302 Transcript_4615/m.7302 type:complete len:1121 (-) Transcript_4615:983-4345(-)